MSSDSPGNRQSQQCGFWWTECSAKAKLWLMGPLVACFATQTALVYLDPVDSPPLTVLAQEGRRIWHRHNCQTCHQFYGFGGFLGPDLTNVSRRIAPERLHRLLAEGSGAMPAFGLSFDEANALSVFLQEMNQTGQGQAKRDLGEFSAVSIGLRQIAQLREEFAESADQSTRTGFDLFMRRGCAGCHLPLGEAIVGAPDLLTTTARLSPDRIMEVLTNGIAPTMPAPDLTPQELEAVYDFIVWVGEHRTALAKRTWESVRDDEISSPSVPWWEYAP